MKNPLFPRFSEVAIPVFGGQKYLDRQTEIIDKMEEEKRYEERRKYGAKALAITGALWVYNVVIIEAALFAGISGLVKLIDK